METIVSGVQAIAQIWFAFFLVFAFKKYADFSYLFSKYDYPAMSKIMTTIFYFWAILNLPQITELFIQSKEARETSSPDTFVIQNRYLKLTDLETPSEEGRGGKSALISF